MKSRPKLFKSTVKILSLLYPPHPSPSACLKESASCHNLWLKKHEFFSTPWQRWHFMFTTIISLVNDSCGCGTYESFREQTETLMLRALNSFSSRCFNSQAECLRTKETEMWPASSWSWYFSDFLFKHGNITVAWKTIWIFFLFFGQCR